MVPKASGILPHVLPWKGLKDNLVNHQGSVQDLHHFFPRPRVLWEEFKFLTELSFCVIFSYHGILTGRL